QKRIVELQSEAALCAARDARRIARVDQHRAKTLVKPEPVADRDVETRPAPAGEHQPLGGAHDGAGREERRHAIVSPAKVRPSPSAKETAASKPSAARAADTSSVCVKASRPSP